jgi:hypothetical protein
VRGRSLGAAALAAAVVSACGSSAAPRHTAAPRALPPLPASCRAGSTYYVDARTGSDSSCGTSRSRPWKTVARVNAAHLPSGASVLFAGGEHVDWGADAPLSPQSGVTYGSYGEGQAIFDRQGDAEAVLLCGVHRVTISGLELDGGSDDGSTAIGLQSSERCPGSTDVTITGLTIRHWFEGIQAGYADARWRIVRTTIEHTAGNGILFDRRDGDPNQGGRQLDVIDSTIAHTGEHPPDYHVHGIYDNAADSQIVGNTITGFQTDGVSIRFHGATVQGNRISGGAEGIGVYEYDSVGGVSRFTDNTISGTSDAGIFVCGPAFGCKQSLDRFVIQGNVIDGGARNPLDLQPAAGGYAVSGNAVR